MKSFNISRQVIVGNILNLFSGNLIGQFATGITLLIIARALGPSKTGQYIASFALARTTSFLFEFGMDSLLLKEGGASSFQLGQLIASNLVLKFLFGLPWLIGLSLVALLLNQETFPIEVLRIAALATWFESGIRTFLTGFKSILRNRITAVLSILQPMFMLVTSIGLIMLNFRTPLIFALVRMLIGGIIFVLSSAWLIRSQKHDVNVHILLWTFAESKAFFTSSGFATLYTQADITIVALFLGKTDVGIYGLATRLIGSLFVIPRTIFSVMVPALSRILISDNSRFLLVFRKMLLSLAIIGGTLWFAIGAFSKPFTYIFLGPEFIDTGNLLSILGPIIFLKAGSFGMASLIVSVGWQKHRVWVQAITATINISLNLLFIIPFGNIAVSWVYVMSETILLIGYTYLVSRWQNQWKPNSRVVTL